MKDVAFFSMPYAQIHYPFEHSNDFSGTRFPADFISEAMDQTRGWFYTLLVLATHLFDTAPWKNLIVCGLVLAACVSNFLASLFHSH
jgi:isoleucyl-tRNA synthetase